MKISLSVIVPCHNPRRDYLGRVLEALKMQSLPLAVWDLVVIDNASDSPLADWVDLAWHPQGRVVREETLGLTPARMRGIAETGGDLLIFVDDDNVLAADYLEQASIIAHGKPFLGAFGGMVKPEYESPPPSWAIPCLGMLGIRDVPASVWSNDINHWASTPIGAGMCVRRDVAVAYLESIGRVPLRKTLDRQGTSLVSGGDMDLAFTGVALGYGMGVFRELRLTHLIPCGRLTSQYLSRLSEAIGYSAVILDALWGRIGYTENGFPSTGALLRYAVTLFMGRWRQRQYLGARRRGAARGRKQLADLALAGALSSSTGTRASLAPQDQP